MTLDIRFVDESRKPIIFTQVHHTSVYLRECAVSGPELIIHFDYPRSPEYMPMDGIETIDFSNA